MMRRRNPATPLAPFPVEINYPETIAGVRSETYIDWLGICIAVTMTSRPVVAIPAGFTASGLPVGLQLIGRPRGEATLLGAAALFEQATALTSAWPSVGAAGDHDLMHVTTHKSCACPQLVGTE